VLLIDDTGIGQLALHLLGPVLNSSTRVTQEGIFVLGAVDAHFEYVSSQPPVRPLLTFNYNIYDEPGGTVSDTWSISIKRLAPSMTDPANVSVDAHFLSDSFFGKAPPALPNGFDIIEDMALRHPTGMPDATYQYVRVFPSDLILGFNSVPEPATFPLVGLALAGLVAFGLRGRKHRA